MVRTAPHWHLAAAAAGIFLLLSSTTASAQQLVRNQTDIPGGLTDYTENVDFADIDNDGDWDAAFAEGGDDGNAQNHIWRNEGGAQGGTVGIFTNVTATQAPLFSDDSRDIEFADIDNDGDLDVYVANTSTNNNQGNRWWTNMGGVQGGTIGFYVDSTATRWAGIGGPGSSIAPTQVLPGNGFIDFSCDCDFADLDNDGDMDLIHSTYGGNFGGQIPTRLFLNNGDGIFSEFNPSGFQLPGQLISNGHPGLWCEGTQQANTTDSTGANCDIATTALGVEMGDVDGDLDIDILHGARNEPTRMFRNRLEENGGTLAAFRDVTGITFPPGYTTGTGHYEQEMGDFDTDGDLDIYGLNWLASGGNFNDCTMKNNGAGVYRALTTLTNSAPDDNEGDFMDYDLDGDIDLFVANFSGQERVYRNDGTGAFTFISGVTTPDFTISLDADAADVDNDGDPDVFVANDADQPEWYLKNNTAGNDVHAPRLYNLEQAPNRTASAIPTVVRVQADDNAPYYGIWYMTVRLEVSVNGGPTQNFTMKTSGGQIFRGRIPGLLIGNIDYKVVAIDRYGNTGVSNTLTFVSTGGSPLLPYCDPNVDGTIACPCGNPPSGSGRGCNNFGAFTGGAVFSATGNPSLSSDTVVLTASAENNTSFTIFLQGTNFNLTGQVFGAGVRCVSGALKRLYNGNAAAGTISRPTTQPPVSVRSASLGDTIVAGQSRYYMSYYRDPNAAGPCGDTSSTFNGTQSGAISWGP